MFRNDTIKQDAIDSNPLQQSESPSCEETAKGQNFGREKEENRQASDETNSIEEAWSLAANLYRDIAIKDLAKERIDENSVRFLLQASLFILEKQENPEEKLAQIYHFIGFANYHLYSFTKDEKNLIEAKENLSKAVARGHKKSNYLLIKALQEQAKINPMYRKVNEALQKKLLIDIINYGLRDDDDNHYYSIHVKTDYLEMFYHLLAQFKEKNETEMIKKTLTLVAAINRNNCDLIAFLPHFDLAFGKILENYGSKDEKKLAIFFYFRAFLMGEYSGLDSLIQYFEANKKDGICNTILAKLKEILALRKENLHHHGSLLEETFNSLNRYYNSSISSGKNPPESIYARLAIADLLIFQHYNNEPFHHSALEKAQAILSSVDTKLLTTKFPAIMDYKIFLEQNHRKQLMQHKDKKNQQPTNKKKKKKAKPTEIRQNNSSAKPRPDETKPAEKKTAEKKPAKKNAIVANNQQKISTKKQTSPLEQKQVQKPKRKPKQESQQEHTQYQDEHPTKTKKKRKAKKTQTPSGRDTISFFDVKPKISQQSATKQPTIASAHVDKPVSTKNSVKNEDSQTPKTSTDTSPEYLLIGNLKSVDLNKFNLTLPELPEVADELLLELEKRGYRAYLRGGMVWQGLLKQKSATNCQEQTKTYKQPDIDIFTDAPKEVIASIIGRERKHKDIDHHEDINNLCTYNDYKGCKVDFYISHARTLEEDAKTIDYSVRSLCRTRTEIYAPNPLALKHLNHRKIFLIDKPEVSFADDPKRIINGLRLCIVYAKYGDYQEPQFNFSDFYHLLDQLPIPVIFKKLIEYLTDDVKITLNEFNKHKFLSYLFPDLCLNELGTFKWLGDEMEKRLEKYMDVLKLGYLFELFIAASIPNTVDAEDENFVELVEGIINNSRLLKHIFGKYDIKRDLLDDLKIAFNSKKNFMKEIAQSQPKETAEQKQPTHEHPVLENRRTDSPRNVSVSEGGIFAKNRSGKSKLQQHLPEQQDHIGGTTNDL